MGIYDVLGTVAAFCYKPLGADKGEDAYAYDVARGDLNALAVFDGCGGAGAWKYPEFNQLSGALVSAQAMSYVFLDWVSRQKAGDDPGKMAEDFRTAAADALNNLKGRCAPMGVTGSLVKSFPCTAAIAVTELDRQGCVQLTSLNAGDSRVYYLTPDRGLIQLTRDDSRGKPDELASLRGNPPLSNLVNADSPFRITTEQVHIPMPCAVLCATDGLFGFVRSPMDFENLLLRSLVESDSAVGFEQLFEGRIREMTGDDSTCLMAFYGFKNYDEIRAAFGARLAALQPVIDRINAAGDDRALETRLVDEEWASYKPLTVHHEMQE